MAVFVPAFAFTNNTITAPMTLYSYGLCCGNKAGENAYCGSRHGAR